MYVDTQTMDVQVIVGVEVQFWGKDARDSNEGDDKDGVRYSGCSPLNVVLTSCLSGTWILNRIFLFILIILTLFLHQLPSILLTHHFLCDLFLLFMNLQTNRTRR